MLIFSPYSKRQNIVSIVTTKRDILGVYVPLAHGILSKILCSVRCGDRVAVIALPGVITVNIITVLSLPNHSSAVLTK